MAVYDLPKKLRITSKSFGKGNTRPPTSYVGFIANLDAVLFCPTSTNSPTIGSSNAVGKSLLWSIHCKIHPAFTGEWVASLLPSKTFICSIIPTKTNYLHVSPKMDHRTAMKRMLVQISKAPRQQNPRRQPLPPPL